MPEVMPNATPFSTDHLLDYRGKIILAPMVRQNSLPFRVACLEYGADIVYTEEIVDQKLLGCTRRENPVLGTIDYVAIDEQVVFRTHFSETSRLVLQLGTADPTKAAAVVEMVQQDVAGFDINMGCPKEYSIKGGMGAALLRTPDLAEDILRRCRGVCRKSLTCKIRLLSSLSDTIEFARRMEATGIDAIAVHGRTREERPNHLNNVDAIRAVVEALKIPVIANGGSSKIHSFDDIDRYRQLTGASSIMIARAAQNNPSIFRRTGLATKSEMIVDCLKKSVDFDVVFTNAKYVVQQIYGDTSGEEGQRLLGSLDLRDICEVFSLHDYFDEVAIRRGNVRSTIMVIKRSCEESGNEVCEDLDYAVFSKKLKRANCTHTPKSKLLEYCVRNGVESAKYDISSDGRRFTGCVIVEGKVYRTTAPHRTKREAEQAATLVALKYLIPDFLI